ncbi:hypothetical protein GF371_02000, partial [Candidatus Woesearchaeota archaeon]|nr:hypothetical protein [Candidatus Woesearchaeota archaeon]
MEEENEENKNSMEESIFEEEMTEIDWEPKKKRNTKKIVLHSILIAAALLVCIMILGPTFTGMPVFDRGESKEVVKHLEATGEKQTELEFSETEKRELLLDGDTEVGYNSEKKRAYICQERDEKDLCKKWKRMRLDIPESLHTVLTGRSGRRPPAELQKPVELLDKKDFLLDTNQTIIADATDDYDMKIEVFNSKINNLVVRGISRESENDSLVLQDNTYVPGAVEAFTIDPSGLDFEELTFTFIATGRSLYKCTAWNQTTNTCDVKRVCTGSNKQKEEVCNVTGGWVRVMQLDPSREYNITIDPADPVFAQYSSALGAPECPGGESACIATSALLQSRDSISGTVEPNQPNTIDACSDGTSGTYLTDESVENITVESLNGSYFRQGDTINMTGTFLCWSTVNDNLNWVYTNSTTSPSWNVKAFTDPCPVARPNFYQGSHTFTLDSNAGTHAVRLVNQYNGGTGTTCGGGAYDDNDDLAFRVYTRIPPNVTELRPVENSTYDVNDTINLSARIEDDETEIKSVQANVTLPDGSTAVVNLSRKIIGEVMENRTINGSWRTISYANRYDDPVVFASPLPLRDLRPAEVRIANVTPTGFEIRAQEPTGDYPESDDHSDEWPISILVVETGIHKLADGTYIEVHKNVSTTTVSGSGPDAWTTYYYDL